MNEIKTLKEIVGLVNSGHEIILLTGVLDNDKEYLIMQDNTDQTHYSVAV